MTRRSPPPSNLSRRFAISAVVLRVAVLLPAVLADATASATDAPAESAALRIDSFTIESTVNPGNKLSIPSDSKLKQTLFVELGEDWQGHLTLGGKGDLSKTRVTLQHINVMSIQNEGPHLDLTDWLRFTSEETTVYPVDEMAAPRTLLLDASQLKSSAFPFTTKADLAKAIAAAVKKQGGSVSEVRNNTERWTKHAAACVTPQTYPCGVGIYQVILRVYPDGDGKTAPAKSLQPLKELTLVLPQGC